MLKGVEASFDKKIDPVLKWLKVCTNKITTLDTCVTEAEGCISSQVDATAIYGAKLSDFESKLAAALDKMIGDIIRLGCCFIFFLCLNILYFV